MGSEAASTRSSMVESLFREGPYADALDFLCALPAGPRTVKLLLAAPGLGKTILLRSALEILGAQARTAYVFWTTSGPDELIEQVLLELGSPAARAGGFAAARSAFQALLREVETAGKRVVIGVDEAHHLSPAALGRLSDLLTAGDAMAAPPYVILAGLPTLQGRLAHATASGLANRVFGVRQLVPLSGEQARRYVANRIRVLHGDAIDGDVAAAIVGNAGGVPRILDQRLEQVVLEQHGNDAAEIVVPVSAASIDAEPDASSRIYAWLAEHATSWSGTVSELAASVGMPPDAVAQAIDVSRDALRKCGVEVMVRRSPGKLRIVTLAFAPPGELANVPGEVEAPAESDGGFEPQPPADPPRTVEEPQAPRSAAAAFSAFSTESDAQAFERGPWRGDGQGGWRAVPLPRLVIIIVGAAVLAGAGVLSLQAVHGSTRRPNTNAQLTQGRAAAAAEVAGLRQRAAAGEIGSITDLADRYRDGNGVPRDLSMALRFYEEAARRGDPVAQYRLGATLASGADGIAPDPVAAYIWLVMAKAGGQPVEEEQLRALTRNLTPREILELRYRLGQMHEQGIGCVADFVTADTWYLLGSAAGDPRSRDAAQALEARMSARQVSEARARSAEWLRRHTPPSNAAVASEDNQAH